MDKKPTREFLSRAHAEAKRRGWVIQTLSRRIFNQNPYAIESLEQAILKDSGGPSHVSVIKASRILAKLEAEKLENGNGRGR